MRIPNELAEGIEAEFAHLDLHTIVEAREQLTSRYRERETSHFMTSQAHRYAYIAARLPATYAAVVAVLEAIKARLPDRPIKSLLDLGAGPGTAMWAACHVFPEIEQVTLIEQDQELIAFGKRLSSYSEHQALKQAHWRSSNLLDLKELPQADLVILSYSIGELPEANRQPLLDLCYQQTTHVLAIIEPGTPVGFERIRAIRRHLITIGGQMVAPCPHAVACPMPDGDWCHFSVRLERSFFHRRLKGGSLGYEDEKYSYVAVSKFPCSLPQTRVLRPPQKRSGHVLLTLCTSEGIKNEIISKKAGEAYKWARKAEWGSPFPPDQGKPEATPST